MMEHIELSRCNHREREFDGSAKGEVMGGGSARLHGWNGLQFIGKRADTHVHTLTITVHVTA